MRNWILMKVPEQTIESIYRIFYSERHKVNHKVTEYKLSTLSSDQPFANDYYCKCIYSPKYNITLVKTANECFVVVPQNTLEFDNKILQSVDTDGEISKQFKRIVDDYNQYGISSVFKIRVYHGMSDFEELPHYFIGDYTNNVKLLQKVAPFQEQVYNRHE